MNSGTFKEYSWKDIERLIYNDIGLDDKGILEYGEISIYVGIDIPKNQNSICVSARKYAQTEIVRLEKSSG